MTKRMRSILFSFIILWLIVLVLPVSSMAGSKEFIEYPKEENVSIDKNWNVVFSRAYKKEEIKSITVTHLGKEIPLNIDKLSSESKAIVAPKEKYKYDSEYELKIILFNDNTYIKKFRTESEETMGGGYNYRIHNISNETQVIEDLPREDIIGYVWRSLPMGDIKHEHFTFKHRETANPVAGGANSIGSYYALDPDEWIEISLDIPLPNKIKNNFDVKKLEKEVVSLVEIPKNASVRVEQKEYHEMNRFAIFGEYKYTRYNNDINTGTVKALNPPEGYTHQMDAPKEGYIEFENISSDKGYIWGPSRCFEFELMNDSILKDHILKSGDTIRIESIVENLDRPLEITFETGYSNIDYAEYLSEDAVNSPSPIYNESVDYILMPAKSIGYLKNNGDKDIVLNYQDGFVDITRSENPPFKTGYIGSEENVKFTNIAGEYNSNPSCDGPPIFFIEDGEEKNYDFHKMEYDNAYTNSKWGFNEDSNKQGTRRDDSYIIITNKSNEKLKYYTPYKYYDIKNTDKNAVERYYLDKGEYMTIYVEESGQNYSFINGIATVKGYIHDEKGPVYKKINERNPGLGAGLNWVVITNTGEEPITIFYPDIYNLNEKSK